MKQIEIISFNMSSFQEWERGTVNRNRHLLYQFLDQPEVKRIVAIDFLPFSFKRVLRNFFQNIVFGPKGEKVYCDLISRGIKVSDKFYVFSTVNSFWAPGKIMKKVDKFLKKIDLKYPLNSETKKVGWSCFPMFVDYLKEDCPIKLDLTIFDAVDNWIEHPSFKKYQTILKNNYQIIAEKSDLIFTVSDNLIDFFKSLGRKENLYWISNGVEVSHFKKESSDLPKDLEKVSKPIVGYLGIIQQRIDVDLLEYLANHNPEKSFVLIGPLWPVYFRRLRRLAVEIKKLQKYKNIYFLGHKKYQETPFYLNHFSVAISPHKLDKFIKSTNSLKALEYLASGLPVVTTPTSGAENLSHLVKIAQDYEDFNKKLNQALEEDNPEARQQRKEKIKEYDWGIKMEKIIKLIKEHF